MIIMVDIISLHDIVNLVTIEIDHTSRPRVLCTLGYRSADIGYDSLKLIMIL